MLSKANKALLHAHALGYVITDTGDVVSHTNKVRKLSTVVGYYKFNIKMDGISRRVKVHRLQAFQKFGDAMFKPGIVVRHLDGDPLNNTKQNIAIGTASDNQLDRPKHERVAAAVHASSKKKDRIPDSKWKAIAKALASGATRVAAAKKYGVAKSSITYKFGTIS